MDNAQLDTKQTGMLSALRDLAVNMIWCQDDLREALLIARRGSPEDQRTERDGCFSLACSLYLKDGVLHRFQRSCLVARSDALDRRMKADGSANAALAAAITDANNSALRFFERACAAGSSANLTALECLLPLIRNAIDALGAASSSEARSAIGHIRNVYAEMATVLCAAKGASE